MKITIIKNLNEQYDEHGISFIYEIIKKLNLKVFTILIYDFFEEKFNPN